MRGYYFSPIQIPFLLPPYPLPVSTPATQAKYFFVSSRKDGVDLVLIYRFGMLTETNNGEHAHNAL